MFDKLLVHPTTRHMLQAFAARPPQSLLYIGPDGMGKRTLAQSWASHITSHIQILEPDEKGTISIEAIRSLYRQTRTKQTERQVLIIDHAEAMSSEAQNAFLKLLEEPQPLITFVLSAPHQAALLPTIVSRVQRIHIHPLSNAAIQSHLQAMNVPAQTIAQIVFAAEGRPAVALQLAQSEDAMGEIKTHMQLAKSLLSQPLYQRLVTINDMAKNRETCQRILRAMLVMGERQLQTNATTPAAAQWLARLNAIQIALERLSNNGNVKATLLQLLSAY